MTEHPRDNLVRALAAAPAAVEGDGNTMSGHFAVTNVWTEISSLFEGNFLERIAPGAFRDTLAERSGQIRVLYDHGADPMIGNKPLGKPTVLREDKVGAYYEVELFDASYVNDLKPAMAAGELGASFRFRVTEETWNTAAQVSDWNPKGLDERTIDNLDLYEFGPVTFPAYAEASVGLRSRTDEFLSHLLKDPLFVARFTEAHGLPVTERTLADLPPTATVDPPPEPAPAAHGDEEETHRRRLERHQRRTAGYVDHLKRLERAEP